MDSIQSKLSMSAMSAYLGVFKEPRGLIRALQFIFAIFAYATACSGSSSVTLNQSPLNNGVSASWSYPYNLQNTPIELNGSPVASISSSNNVKPSAQFFVFTGVTSMILALILLLVYVFLDRQYRNDERLPIIDFVITVIWSIFWIAGSSAWAQGVSNIRSQTSPAAIAQRSGVCSDAAPCIEVDSGAYANIIVSVIFGFLNFILWTGSAWFIYKETKFFKSRIAQQQQHQTQQGSFSDMGSSTMQQPYIGSPSMQQPYIGSPTMQQTNIGSPGMQQQSNIR